MARTKLINIIQAIKSPRLFAPLFGDLSSWFAWLVFLKALFGLPMDAEELAVFTQCTGRTLPPQSGASEAYAVVGRRGGKSRIVAFVGTFIACFLDFSKYLAPGEMGMVLILARDKDQAGVVFNYIEGILRNVPVLNRMVVAWRADEIELSNGIIIAVKASDYRSVRGVTIVCCICDEVAFWDSQGANPDSEIFTALRPAMSTIPNAKLLCISTGYARFGVMFEAHRQFYGVDNPRVLVWQADTRTMNPTIPQELIDAELERDPSGAKSEWLGLFREDIEACFSLEMIEPCVIPGRVELMPSPSTRYSAFVDPSGGRHDRFTLAIGHNNNGVCVVDLIRAWTPPLSPAAVTAECAEIFQRYKVRQVTGDRYGGEWPRDEFRKHGVRYEVAEKTRSELYLELIPALCSKRVELLDNRRAIEELRRLERKRGRSGKDIVDHPKNGSDDVANVVAGIVDSVGVGKKKLSPVWGRDVKNGTRSRRELVSIAGPSGLRFQVIDVDAEKPPDRREVWQNQNGMWRRVK